MKRTKVALLGLLLTLGLFVQTTRAWYPPTDARALNSSRVPLLRAAATVPIVEQVSAIGMTVSDMDASIDFLCLPSFDSPSVFAALLDAERGGRFQIAPIIDRATRKQLYLPDTNVLLTRFLHADGVAEVSDFMPVEDAGQAHNLVRRANTVRGELRFRAAVISRL